MAADAAAAPGANPSQFPPAVVANPTGGNASTAWFDNLPDAVPSSSAHTTAAPPSITAFPPPQIPADWLPPPSRPDATPTVVVHAKHGGTDTSWFDALPDAPQATSAHTAQGGPGAAQQPPDASTWSGIAGAIPSGLYRGVAGVVNAPTALWNLGAAGVHAIGGPDLSLQPPINENPTGYQPHGQAERMAYQGAAAVGSLPAMAVGGELAAPVLRALGGASESLPVVGSTLRTAADAGASVAQSFTDVPSGAPSLATGARALSRVAPAPLRPAIVSLGNLASRLPVGTVPQAAFAGGAAGQYAAEHVPVQWAPLASTAANLAVGGGLGAAEVGASNLASRGASALGRAGIGPRSTIYGPDGQPLMRATQAQQEAVAQRLGSAAGTDLPQFRSALNNARETLVPGSEPTTAQLAPTPGIVGLEQAHRVASPEPFSARAAAQNNARLAAIQQQGPVGDPAAVGQWFREQLTAADQAGQIGLATRQGDIGAQAAALGGTQAPEDYAKSVMDAVNARRSPFEMAAAGDVVAAQADRNTALGALPGGRQAIPGGAIVPEQYGAIVRAQVMQARASEAAAVDRLKGLVDPDGTAGVAAAPFREAVDSIYLNRPHAEAPPTGEEAAIGGIAHGWGDLVPLSEVFALRQRVGDAISDMLPPGASATVPVRRLQQVKAALDDALANTAAQQAAFEGQEVSAGRMAPGASILGRLQAETGQQDVAGPLGTPAAGSGGIFRQQSAGTGEAADVGAGRGQRAPQGGLGTGPGYRGVATAATDVGPARARKPESLIDFLIARGGVQDQGGDLRAIGADTVHHQAGGRLVNPRGVYPDYAREAAEEAGFLRPQSTIRDLYDAIAEHVSGRPVYRASEQAEGDAWANMQREADRSQLAYDLARGQVEDLAGGNVRMSPLELDHAAQLVQQGAHPQQAIMDAVRYGDELALQRNAQANAFGPPGMPAGARNTPLALPGGSAGPRNLRPLTSEQLQAHRDYLARAGRLQQTFNAGPAADILAFGEHRTAADVPPSITRARGGFAASDAEVMGKILRKGVTEAEATRQALDAGVEPETLTAALADELRARAVGPDGEFDPKEYAKFRRDHAGALHVFPETLAAFDGAAKAQATLDAAEAAQRETEAAHPLRGVGNASIMSKYWRPGDEGAETVRQFVNDTGGDPAAARALDRYAVYRLRDEGAIDANGTVNASALNRYVGKYQRALSQRPTLATKLGDLSTAHARALADYENGAARNFLHDEPVAAIRKAFSSSNPGQTFSALARMVKGNPDAEAGLRRGVIDFIVEKTRSATPSGEDTDFLKADTFRRWIRANSTPLKALFGGQGVQNLDMVAADLRRQATRGVAVPGSPTATYAAGVKQRGLVPGGHGGAGLGVSVMTLLGERLGEMAGGHGVVGALALPALATVGNAIRQAGIRSINDLERFAMLHPNVARQLVARVPTGGTLGPLVQRRIAASITAALAAQTASLGQERLAQ